MEKKWIEFGDNNLYRVSNYGEVESRMRRGGRFASGRASDSWKPLCQSMGATDKHGGYYMVVGCKINGSFKVMRVHRLVAELFIRKPEKLEQVNHIDGNRENNRLDNLEIVSAKENIQNALRRGSFHRGQCAGKKTITKEVLKDIQMMISQGRMNKEIAEKYNVDPSNISKIRHGHWKSLKYFQ